MADDAGKKQRTARQSAARRRAIRERMMSLSSSSSSSTKMRRHAAAISRYHVLEKRIAQTADDDERAILRAQQDQRGGLTTYQAASETGAKYGESSRWLVKTIEGIHGRRATRVLDVGAIAGTAYNKFKSFDATYIDLNPRAKHVQKADFLELEPPSGDAALYDVVALSLVLNFVGDIGKRTQMLQHARSFVKSQGYLYLVLPLACIANSRYMDKDRFESILETLGWKMVAHHDSSRLTHWLLCLSHPNTTKWPRKELRSGVDRNNFVLVVK